jgi:hypothetical protein
MKFKKNAKAESSDMYYDEEAQEKGVLEVF